jgi:hypothetical protein
VPTSPERSRVVGMDTEDGDFTGFFATMRTVMQGKNYPVSTWAQWIDHAHRPECLPIGKVF